MLLHCLAERWPAMSAAGLHCNSGLVAELDASRSITAGHEFMLELWRAWVYAMLEKQQAVWQECNTCCD